MSCPKSILASAFLDKELPGADRTAFEAHLQGCPDCSRELEDLRSLQKAFVGAERHGAPYGFAARVLTRTAEREKRKSPAFAPFFITFAEAAVLLIVITVGILAGRVMTNGRSAVAHTTNIASSLSLDLFDATPPGSVGGAYLAMMEVKNEK